MGLCYGLCCRHVDTLLVNVQLSAECSIVSLIYVERLMKQAKVTLLAVNWRPILLCGMLMASKVCDTPPFCKHCLLHTHSRSALSA